MVNGPLRQYLSNAANPGRRRLVRIELFAASLAYI